MEGIKMEKRKRVVTIRAIKNAVSTIFSVL
jgi:hypothetical protein